jgi:hypothetical protein
LQAPNPHSVRRGATAAGGKGTRLLGEREDQLATDLVLVVPEAGMDIDRLEWAKQLVHNAVRSPHTQQAYEYAIEQFFQWAAGRAISRQSVPASDVPGSILIIRGLSGARFGWPWFWEAGSLAKIEVALSNWEDYQVKLLGEQLRKDGASRPRHPRCQVRFPSLRVFGHPSFRHPSFRARIRCCSGSKRYSRSLRLFSTLPKRQLFKFGRLGQ